jgi:hypothetical protein
MASFTFASIAHPEKYGYKFDSSTWMSNSTQSETNYHFRQFETYGHGLVQHSGDWSVTFEYLTDYLASLAAAMLGNAELTRTAAFVLRERPRTELIAFAASVVWKESDDQYDKRRYYSVELRKLGTRTKQHDKRYNEISKFLDGSRSSILFLVNSEYADGLTRFQNAEAVREWANSQTKYVPEGENWPVWFAGDHRKNVALRSVLTACASIVESLERREQAEYSIENYKAALERAAVESASIDSAA